MSEGVSPLQHYFETHGLAYLQEHTRMRTTGLQLFTAIQGGLFLAWSQRHSFIFILVGIVSDISFWWWDERNRFVFRILRQWGEAHVDRHLFGVGGDGKALSGINKIFSGTIEHPKLFSHTWAIRLLILATFLGWGLAAQETLQENWPLFALISWVLGLLLYWLNTDRVIPVSWKNVLRAL